MTENTDILIVGAGPTGLVLALWLTRLGVRVRIIDKTSEPGTTSRALAVQARTLELYRQVGLADAVVARGRKMAAINLWMAGKQVAHVVFGDMGADISPFPYALIYPQDEHERLLIDRLAEAGVNVERQTELVAFEETAQGVRASLRARRWRHRARARLPISPAATARTQPSARLCRSVSRAARTTISFTSPTSTRAARVMNGELHGALDTTEFLIVFPLKDEGRARLIGTVRTDAEHQHDELTWDDVSQRVIEWMRIDVERVHWFSTYRVHHRVADQFRKGRAFLLGDAAHIHSPVGGQGMNTGIGDAVNLAWKIADVVHGRARCLAPRQLRAGTHRLRPAAGRDDRSGIHRRDERRGDRPASPSEHRARRGSGGVRDQGCAALHVSHDLADRRELSGQQLERGARRNRARRRPVAVGDGDRTIADNFTPLTSLGLAGPRVRRRRARYPGGVC